MKAPFEILIQTVQSMTEKLATLGRMYFDPDGEACFYCTLKDDVGNEARLCLSTESAHEIEQKNPMNRSKQAKITKT
eukprot:10563691-Ditylum_brightwellii.AAC.2